MKRENLEHIIRVVGSITNRYEFFVIGSQAILGSHPDARDILAYSQEADLFVDNDDEWLIGNLIDSIGEGSPFHETFGYYAQGVADDTAVLPGDWKERVFRIQNNNTNQYIAYCLSPEDIAISKLIAGREKDYIYVDALINEKMVDPAYLVKLIDDSC